MAGTRVDADRLWLELARRGWYEGDLAVVAEISAATVTAALQGWAISARTLREIALALTRAPVLDQLDWLLQEAEAHWRESAANGVPTCLRLHWRPFDGRAALDGPYNTPTDSPRGVDNS